MQADSFMQLEQKIKKPSVVFYLIDDFTGNKPTGNIEVSIDGIDTKPVRNRSGYYIFFGLPEMKLEFVIKADGFEEKREKVLIKKDSPAIKTINLIPLSAYSFPSGSTIIRGTVFEEGTAKPIEGVMVSLNIFGKNKQMATARDGKLVIYLNELNENRTIKRNGSYIVKDNTNTDFSLAFTRQGYSGVNNKIIVTKEGVEEEREKFNLIVGKVTNLKKYLKRDATP